MTEFDKKRLLLDFLKWAEYNRSTQLQYMPEWDGGYYGVDQDKLINEFLEEEL